MFKDLDFIEHTIKPIEEIEIEKPYVMRLYPDGSMHDGDIEKGTTEIEKELEEKQE